MRNLLQKALHHLWIMLFIVCFIMSEQPMKAKLHEKFEKSPTGTNVKNVVLMIGDGMGVGQLEIARLLQYGKEGSLFMESLPHVALMRTNSNDQFVTDSAAAGTALATGIKTNNGMIGLPPTKEKVVSILDTFQQAGKKVGIITTSSVTDATPASFVGNTENRWDGQPDIARQMLEKKLDVILGGGATFFSPEQQNNTQLVDRFKKEGYTYVNKKQALTKAEQATRLIGLFHPTYMSFKIDKQHLKNNEPSLMEMTDAGLTVLSKTNNGFFLMVEGGRIDHAAHSGDVTSVWKETIEFDETVKKVVRWAEARQDTLVVVLADHETMGMAVSEPINFKGLQSVNASAAYMANEFRKNNQTANVKTIFKKYANIDLTDMQINQLKKDVTNAGRGIYPQQVIDWEIGYLIANHYKVALMSRHLRTESKTTSGHTGNMVPIFAYGPQSQRFEGVLQNTDISKLIAEIANVSFQQRSNSR